MRSSGIQERYVAPLRPVRQAGKQFTRDELLGSWIVHPGGAVQQNNAPGKCACDDIQPDMAKLEQRVANLEQAIAILAQGDPEPAQAKQAADPDKTRHPQIDQRTVTQDRLQARERQARAAAAKEIRSISAAFRRHYSVGGR